MKISAVILFFMMGFTAQARAEQFSELTRFFEEAVSLYDPAVSATPAAEGPGSEGEGERWYVRNFWLRLRPKFGVEVPWVAKFQVIPEVEMLWQRQNPEGYSTYHP